MGELGMIAATSLNNIGAKGINSIKQLTAKYKTNALEEAAYNKGYSQEGYPIPITVRAMDNIVNNLMVPRQLLVPPSRRQGRNPRMVTENQVSKKSQKGLNRSIKPGSQSEFRKYINSVESKYTPSVFK